MVTRATMVLLLGLVLLSLVACVESLLDEYKSEVQHAYSINIEDLKAVSIALDAGEINPTQTHSRFLQVQENYASELQYINRGRHFVILQEELWPNGKAPVLNAPVIYWAEAMPEQNLRLMKLRREGPSLDYLNAYIKTYHQIVPPLQELTASIKFLEDLVFRTHEEAVKRECCPF